VQVTVYENLQNYYKQTFFLSVFIDYAEGLHGDRHPHKNSKY